MVRGRTLMDERTARMEAAEVADEVRERIQDRNEGSGSSGSSLLSWRRVMPNQRGVACLRSARVFRARMRKRYECSRWVYFRFISSVF